jgi:hypothetical protein
LPWLGYFDLLNNADVFVHYDGVQFDKHGWLPLHGAWFVALVAAAAVFQNVACWT